MTRLAPTQVELEIPISPEAIAAAEERAFRKLARNAKVPGFRPGKIPRKVFEQNYGANVINAEAMEEVVPEAYSRAIREHDLEPVERPHMELLPHDEGSPLTIKATVAVRPEITLGSYKGITLERDADPVSDEDVERSLQALARDRGTLVPVDREARLGDFVVIDYAGTIDGVAFDGGSAEGQTTELDEQRFIPGFASGIAGMTPGQTREVTATFPEGYQKEELAGKDAIFTVRLHEVKEMELPAIDDAFAQTVSKNENLQTLREDIRKRLEAIKENQSRKTLGNAIVDKLIEMHDFPLPEVMVQHEMDSMLSDSRTFAGRMGLGWEEYLATTGKSEEELRADFRPDAEKRVKGVLLIEAIAKAENINATPADIQAELQNLAEQYGQPIDRIRAALGNNVLSLMDGIVRSKTLDWLIEEASVVQRAPATVSADA